MVRLLFVSGLLACVCFSQVNFENGNGCSSPFVAGCGTPGGLDNVSWNGALGDNGNTGAMVSGGGCNGQSFARVWAHGPLNSPIGGPMPQPAAGQTSQLYVPIPATATQVGFCWDFFNQETTPQPQYNDGMCIELVGAACGPGIVQLVYADTATPLSIGGSDTNPCGFGAPDVIAQGFQTVGPFPCAGAAFLRVTCWNGGDQGFTSCAAIDNVCFDNPPCNPPCQLQFSAPAGPGSIAMTNTTCVVAAGQEYFVAIKVGVGAFPAGWFFGVDLGIPELINLFSLGAPFTGTLDATGASLFGVPAGVPSGLPLTAVTTHWSPGYASLLGARTAVFYVTP